MKDFIKILKRYVTPYKKYMGGSVVLNILSVVFNLFSFAFIVPILQILFRLSDKVYEFIPWETEMDFKDKFINNAYWWIGNYMETA